MSNASAAILQSTFAKQRTGHPYPGFRPFRRDEWPVFFGRDRQVKSLLGLLAEHHFICVHGPSGSGKSSLIEAGLLAALERGYRRMGTEWFTGTFQPGASPLLNLARCLTRALNPRVEFTDTSVVEMYGRLLRPGGSIVRALNDAGLPENANLLLVVDQFEELFRFRELGDPQEANRFIDLLLDVFDMRPEGIHVVIATRTDFLGSFSDIVGLAEAANAAPFLTPALTEDELRAAIRGPVDLHKRTIEPELVELLLTESANEPDRLPILQHALRRCWDVASRLGTPGQLTVQVYRSDAIRSVREALNSHASEVMRSPELQGLEREVELTFRALTDVDSQRRIIRRPLPWSQLLAETGCPPASIERVVNCFRAEGTGFLGRPRPDEKELKPDTVVDISHEALIRRWQSMNRVAPAGAGRPRDGWLWNQVEDGHQYRALLVIARSEGQVITAGALKTRLAWWQRQQRTPAWARRLSDNRDATELDAKADIATVEELFARSARVRTRQLWGNALVALVVVATLGILGKYFDREFETAANDRANVERSQRDLARFVQTLGERDDLQRKLNETQALLEAANERLASLPATIVPTVPAAPIKPEAVQVAPKALSEPSAAPVVGAQTCEGALWIGSGNTANIDLAGNGTGRRPAMLGDVKAGQRFILNKNLYLRRGLPQAGYVQQESIGIVPNGATIVALGNPEPYERPSGVQYWIKARTASQVCSLVYMQFANGSAPEALKLAKALEADGYLVPGQEQLSSAIGLAEVRYYYDDDRDAADRLVKDVTADARELNVARNREFKVKDLRGWKGTKPPRGTLELWVDLSNL